MTALKVIGIILLILLLIASVRVRALARFGEKTELTLFVGPFRMTLLPEKEKKPAPDGRKKAAEEKKTEETGKKRWKLPKLTRAEKKDLIRVAFAALRETARRACKRLCINPFEILVVFGGEDPADIAQHYGYANALMWGVMPQLEDLFRIPDPSLHLRMDYSAKERARRERWGCQCACGTGFSSPARCLRRCSNGIDTSARRTNTTRRKTAQRRPPKKVKLRMKN